MSERVVESLSKFVNRRRFLRDVGAAAIGGALLLMGMPQTAAAITCKCCSFPQVNYCSTNPCASCGCRYAWYCTHSDGLLYQCNDCGCPPPGNCAYYRPGPSLAGAG